MVPVSVPGGTCRSIDALHAPSPIAFPENVSPPNATWPQGDISQRSTAPAPSAPVGEPVPAIGPRLIGALGAGAGSWGSVIAAMALRSTAAGFGRAPDLGAGATRLVGRGPNVLVATPPELSAELPFLGV